MWEGSKTSPAPFAEQGGKVTIDLAATDTGSAPIAFVTDRFTVAPVISLSVSNYNYLPGHTSVTTSGFTANIRHYLGSAATTTITVHWRARQMYPNQAEG